ncbi:hypothetical protein KW548_21080 [Vibrio neptunius]|nr:hypothetical protein [Vibrio neptunius]QXX08155.1 hypothetical protein KW548_21080 [Vibrio neptunius]
MQRKKKHGVLLGYQYPQQLVNWREKITQRIPIEPQQDPLEPFMEVTEDALAVRDSLHNLRLPYLLPLVLGLWFIVFLCVGELGFNSASINTGKKRLAEYQIMEERGITLMTLTKKNTRSTGLCSIVMVITRFGGTFKLFLPTDEKTRRTLS